MKDKKPLRKIGKFELHNIDGLFMLQSRTLAIGPFPSEANAVTAEARWTSCAPGSLVLNDLMCGLASNRR